MDTSLSTLPAVGRGERAGGRFTIDHTTSLDTRGFAPLEQARIERLLRFLPFNLDRTAKAPTDVSGKGNTVRFTVDNASLTVEEYRIDVSPERVDVRAGSLDACSLAIATLRQLLPVDSYRHQPSPSTAWDLPCCSIADAPTLAWRGLLLDVSRHFLPKHGVLRLLERMADLRLNRLQLHLSDDQGWRFESKRFPLLHERGSLRTRSQLSHFNEPPVFDETPHGGYYSQDDLREIVAFAADRAIVVVPEIDLTDSDAIVMAWRGLGIAQRAAAAGRDVILAPVFPLYFDYSQSDDEREPMAIGGPISLDDVAGFDFSGAGWPDDQRRGVLGAQAQLWTEWVASEREIDFALFPRLCAFAEIAWTGAPAASGFSDRLAAHLQRFDAAGVEYRALDGPRQWQEGGTGHRAHRSPWPLHDMLARLERAALTGSVAFGGDD